VNNKILTTTLAVLTLAALTPSARADAEPDSPDQWNVEAYEPTPIKPDATPTTREHVDEILDAPSLKEALRAWADWMDEATEAAEALDKKLEAEEIEAEKAVKAADEAADATEED
jgi:hypothetical protein